MGEPKTPTPEEMAKIQKAREKSDKELVKGTYLGPHAGFSGGGAKEVEQTDGSKRLEATDEQIEKARREMEYKDGIPWKDTWYGQDEVKWVEKEKDGTISEKEKTALEFIRKIKQENRTLTSEELDNLKDIVHPNRRTLYGE